MKKLLPLGGLLLLALPGCPAQPVLPPDTTATTEPAYRAALRQAAARRQRLGAAYGRAATPAARAAVLGQAGRLLGAVLDSTIFPAWAGTEWAFYGTSWAPRRGQIACGYFVTTALHDAGLRLARTALAQQTSETLIKNLVAAPDIRRYRGLGQAAFVRAVRAQGPGLYVVGLDFHVAFLRVPPGGGPVEMVHSTYLDPGCVVREPAASAAALASNYRVLGKVSADAALLRHWLRGDTLAAHGIVVRE